MGHGVRAGYTDSEPERVVRGHRLLCSNRGRSRGCGRTTTVWLATVVRRAIVSAASFLQLAAGLAMGLGCAAAWRQACSMSISTGYRCKRRLSAAQVHIRATLSARAPPPDFAGAHPIGQTLAHLAAVLGEHATFETYQLAMQAGVLG